MQINIIYEGDSIMKFIKKEKIASLLLAATMLTSGTSAFADIYDGEDIDVIYDGNYIGFFENEPINVDGRIKLPFRDLLESMGANISFDDSTKTVSAEKDGTVITFSLDSDTIYVDKNGEQSSFTMDTSIDVINDRTYVPVRFIAEAFGFTVGWDDEAKSVTITDVDGYMQAFNEKCSNYAKLYELSANLSKNYASEQKISFSYDIEANTDGELSHSNIKFDLDTSTAKKDSLIKSDNTLSLSSLNMFKMPDDSDINLQDVTMNVILDGEKLYISTNLAEVFAAAYPDNESAKLAAELISSDTWLEGTLDDLFVTLFEMDEASSNVYKQMILNSQSGNRNSITKMLDTYDENSALSAQTFPMQMQIITALMNDDVFKLTENPDGTYDYSLNLSSGTIPLDDNILAEILSDSDFKITQNGKISDNEMTATTEVNLNMDMEDILKLNMSVTSDGKSSINTVTDGDIQIPSEGVNLNTVLMLIKHELDK